MLKILMAAVMIIKELNKFPDILNYNLKVNTHTYVMGTEI